MKILVKMVHSIFQSIIMIIHKGLVGLFSNWPKSMHMSLIYLDILLLLMETTFKNFYIPGTLCVTAFDMMLSVGGFISGTVLGLIGGIHFSCLLGC